MSNSRIRKYLEGLSAPVIAWLIDHGYVYDDCGILNAYRTSIREGVLIASRAVQNMTLVAVPDIRSAADRHNTPMRVARERL